MPRELRRITDKTVSAPPSRRVGDAALIRIPLNLKSIIAPYRDRGRFTIRLEHLPQLARLSAGTNNGDRTWSLALDELEDLAYFPPAGVGAHTLAVRLIVKDEDGAHTLALIDLDVDAGADAAADRRDGGAVIALAQDKALLAELAQLRAALVEREAELAERDAMLAERDAELAHRNARLADRENELLEQQQLNGWMTALAEENREAELQSELALAKRAWAETEALSRDALKQELEAQFRDALAEQDQRSGAVLDALSYQHEEAMNELRQELAGAKSAIAMQMAEKAAWQTEVAKLQQEFEDKLRAARAEVETETVRLQQAFEEKLRAARASAEAEAGNKLQASEAAWQKRLAELAARCEVAEARLVSQPMVPQPDHAAELAQLRAQLECVEQDSQWALKEAKAAAQREVVATLKAAEAEWQNQVALAQTDASVVADLRAQLERARQEGEQAAATARAEVEQEMSARLTAVEAEWRQRSGQAVAELTQRCGEVEAALAEANKHNAADSDAYIRELNVELRTLRKSLVGREADLARVKAVLEEERTGVPRGTASAAAWKPVMGHRGLRETAPEKGDRRLMRDAAIVAVVVMAVVLAWPYVKPWFVEEAGPVPVAAMARPKPVPVGAILSIATVERGVNLRAGPSVKDKVLGSAMKGADVTILEERGNWVRGVVSGAGQPSIEGWIYKSALGESRQNPAR
jgi:hypothetical protein